MELGEHGHHINRNCSPNATNWQSWDNNGGFEQSDYLRNAALARKTMIPTSQKLDVKTRILQAKKSWTRVDTTPLGIVSRQEAYNWRKIPWCQVLRIIWAITDMLADTTDEEYARKEKTKDAK